MLNPQHFQEWLDSAVHPDLIALNVRSLDDGFDELLYSQDLPRRNDGRLTDAYLHRYQHLEHGGWFCSGIDPLTGADSEWGCFKPDHPRLDPDKGKPIKYEHPPKLPTELFCLKLPPAIATKIVSKYSPLLECSWLDAQDNGVEFWQWVKAHPTISIVITEGAKKAASLLSQGYAAIALPGIYSGYRAKDEQGNPLLNPYLIPQLEVFCQPGREFVFCFDQDKKPKTITQVRTAISRTGRLLKEKGCKVSVIFWYTPEKGIDDLILARGGDTFDRLYSARLGLEKFGLRHHTDLTAYVSQWVTSRFLEELTPPDTAKVVAIKSAKGTGKTEAFTQQIEKVTASGQRVIVLVHREQLAKDLASRFGVPYRTDIQDYQEGSQLGYVLCIDSLHPNANPSFNPEHWEGCHVFIDEVEQVIRHLLNSSTCRKQRVAILQTFIALLNGADRIWVADADLTKVSLDYLIGLLSEPVIPWVLVNEWQPKIPRLAWLYDSPESLFSDLVEVIKNGERVMVHSSGQKVQTQYGTINLESLLKSLFPDLKILRIDSESVSTPEHPAYGVMGNLNSVLPLYGVVIASPTLETGISIDIEHFDRVFCFASGNQTVESVCQSLARVRSNIPRHLWVQQYSSQRIGNGSYFPAVLLQSQTKFSKHIFSLLSQLDALSDLDGDSPRHTATWAKYAAFDNYGYQHYRESVYDHLQQEGYHLLEADTPDDCQDWKDQIKTTSQTNYANHCQQVTVAPILDEGEYEKLQNQKAKTESERLSEKKTAISRRYATDEVTPDLVQADDDGLYGQLQLHYFLTLGHAFLQPRDVKKAQALSHHGKVFSPDLNQTTYSLQVKALQALNIEQFFDGNRTFTSDGLREWFEKVLACRRDVKTFLNQSVNPKKDTAIGVAQRLLGTMGLKLTCIGQRTIDGKRQRVYQMTDLYPNDRAAIFARWFDRDAIAYPHTPSIKDSEIPPVSVMHHSEIPPKPCLT